MVPRFTSAQLPALPHQIDLTSSLTPTRWSLLQRPLLLGQRLSRARQGPLPTALLLLIAGALAIEGQRLLDTDRDVPVALGLYLAAMVLVTLTFLGRPAPVRHLAIPAWTEWALVALIVGLALALRLYRLEDMPPGLHTDEASYGMEAIHIAEAKAFPIWSDLVQGGRVTGHAYAVAPFFKAFGANIFTLRLVSALAGTATVLALYLFAREAFGSRVALIAAFLLAVSRWHLNYSRIGWEVILAPLAGVLAAFFLLRGVHTRNAWWYAASGAMLSAGMYTYISYRVIPFVFLAIFLLLLIQGRLTFLRQHWLGLVAFAVAAFLVFAPLGKWAWQHPDRFNSRFRQVSVFKVNEPLESLGGNIGRELAMFNYRGPPFPHQNLPGAPMLSTPFGILFALGVGLVVARLGKPGYAFAALFITAGIATAVLAIPAETPHAHRSIMAVPMVALVAGLFLSEAGLAVEQLLSGRAKVAVVALIFPLLALTAGLEADTYFNKQAHDPRVWNDFVGEATQVARYVDSASQDHDVLVDPFYYHDLYGIRLEFIAYNARGEYRPLNYVENVPAQTAARGVVYVLHPHEKVLLQHFKRIYPNGIFEEHRDPFGDVAFMTYQVSQAEIAAVRGLGARYYDNANWEGPPAVARQEAAIVAEQGSSSLAPPYTVEWTGSLYVPSSGLYRMRVEGDGEGSVELDGEAFPASGRLLETGLHPLRVRYRQTGARRATLVWEMGSGSAQAVPPQVLYAFDVGLNGLQATYWTNYTFAGEPAFLQIDRAVFANDIVLGPYSIEWNGWLRVEQSGDHTLSVLADDGLQLYLDDALAVTGEGNLEATLNLSAGYHKIRLRYWQSAGGAQLQLAWKQPDGEKALIPPEAFFYRLPSSAPAGLSQPNRSP